MLSSCLKQETPLQPDENFINLSIVTPGDGTVYQFGEPIIIEAALRQNEFAYIVEFYVNNNRVASRINEPYTIELYKGVHYRPGSLKIRVKAASAFLKEYEDSISVVIEDDDIPVYDIEVINRFDHDPASFTQGLVYDAEVFYESAGLYGESSLRKTTVESGEILQLFSLPDNYFAEGLTLWGNDLVQITWRERTGFIYDKSTFDTIRTFSYATEGWGLTHDGSQLIMSDGTSALYFLDPNTFHVNSSISVNTSGQPLYNINELEFIYGDVFANIWRSTYIARIDLKTGVVIAWIDLEQISRENTAGVLNGIAFDQEGQRLFITGKRWSNLYEIGMIPRAPLSKRKVLPYASDSL